jgi:protein phosphatase
VKITIPELSLVVLVGASGCGKSSFARKLFKSTEVLSSDYCRGLVADDENDQSATPDAFEVLHFIARKRLAAGRLTVIDATNVQPESRKPLVEIAREFHVLPVAIVFDLPEKLCHERNQSRPDRQFGPHVVRNQSMQLRRSMKGLEREGFRHVFRLASVGQVDTAELTRQPLWNNKKDEHGPFDIIGDVHGCYDELTELLAKLGYEKTPTGAYKHPEGRKAIFVGDLVDRGPKIPETVTLVKRMVDAGDALCVPGNHDIKLVKAFRGRNVQLTHGLADSVNQFAEVEKQTAGVSKEAADFLDGLVSHYVLDDGKLVVAHAGMKEAMQGRGSAKVRDFALFGETTGETDEYGLPVRYNWAAEYRGKAMVVYGHTPVAHPEWLNRTINIDTGCVYGGKLTALRYPERELVQVEAHRTYYESKRQFLKKEAAEAADPATGAEAELTTQQQLDDLLDIKDVLGKRIIHTRLHRNITIREENATAALEVMSRFAANPKWLIYLPPTMSPCATSTREGLLEHPEEAFAYYAEEGAAKVVCEQKHMGSRAVVVVCRNALAARRRFGIVEGESGICYTRTGRRFFADAATETALLERVRAAAERAGLWEELKTEWLCLDCELMPWSAKAQELLRTQYAPVGAAANAGLGAVMEALASASENEEIAAMRTAAAERKQAAELYVEAYRRYCWRVESLEDLKLAPFHLLASKGAVHIDKPHTWHMEMLRRMCEADEKLLLATPYRMVDVGDTGEREKAVAWWEELTASGGEGMVVKPLEFAAAGPKGLVQPAVKVRGREYLRIIYGPEYTRAEHLARLRQRGLGRKRSLAVREFALGIEGLERFVQREPLRRVHECVFGVLALESEPVDPRL